jgi:hypothetical protein
MKKIFRLIIFMGLFSFLVYSTYEVLSWKDTTGGYESTTTRLYESEDNSIDVAFFGSSHCFCSVLPYVLWEEHGISAFNMGTSGQDREATYYYIKEVLKTQQPQVICVDLYALTYDGYAVDGNLYRNMLSMDLSQNNLELIEVSVEEEDKMDFITRWPIIHTRYAELERYDFETNDFSVFGRGEVVELTREVVYQDTEVLNHKEIGMIPEVRLEWIERLVELSENEDFELVFFNAPFFMSKEDKALYNAAAKYFEEHEILYIDFNDNSVDAKMDYENDFIDYGHVNIYGGEKITKYLGGVLTSEFEFENHKGDPKYEFWDKDLEYCQHALQEPIVKNTYDWTLYSSTIMNSEDLVVVISLDGSYEESTLNLFGMFIPLELEMGYSKGGKWIIEDGQVTHRIEEDDDNVIFVDMGEDVLRIENGEYEDSSDDVMISGKSLEFPPNALTVVIYDKILKKVIDQKSWY